MDRVRFGGVDDAQGGRVPGLGVGDGGPEDSFAASAGGAAISQAVRISIVSVLCRCCSQVPMCKRTYQNGWKNPMTPFQPDTWDDLSPSPLVVSASEPVGIRLRIRRRDRTRSVDTAEPIDHRTSLRMKGARGRRARVEMADIADSMAVVIAMAMAVVMAVTIVQTIKEKGERGIWAGRGRRDRDINPPFSPTFLRRRRRAGIDDVCAGGIAFC